MLHTCACVYTLRANQQGYPHTRRVARALVSSGRPSTQTHTHSLPYSRKLHLSAHIIATIICAKTVCSTVQSRCVCECVCDRSIDTHAFAAARRRQHKRHNIKVYVYVLAFAAVTPAKTRKPHTKLAHACYRDFAQRTHDDDDDDDSHGATSSRCAPFRQCGKLFCWAQ